MSQVRFALARFALAAASLLVVLLLCEGALRLATEPTLGSGRAFGPWLKGQVVFDPVLGWRNEPGTWPGRRETADGWADTSYTVDRHGFRGPAIADRKPEGTTRIVCMGDSGTFGALGVPAETEGEALLYFAIPSYVDVLRERMARDGLDHVEVVNAGVIGYSSHHGLRQLMVQILALEPDVVTLRFGANDVQPAWAPGHRAVEPESGLSRLLLYRFAGWRTTRLLLGARTLPRFHPPANSLDWASRDEHARNLERMIARSRAHGANVLIMDYPVRHEDWSKLKELQATTREIAGREGVPFLQTGPQLLADGARGFNAHDRVHPSEQGARLTADLLFQGLRDLGWIGSKPR